MRMGKCGSSSSIAWQLLAVVMEEVALARDVGVAVAEAEALEVLVMASVSYNTIYMPLFQMFLSTASHSNPQCLFSTHHFHHNDSPTVAIARVIVRVIARVQHHDMVACSSMMLLTV